MLGDAKEGGQPNYWQTTSLQTRDKGAEGDRFLPEMSRTLVFQVGLCQAVPGDPV